MRAALEVFASGGWPSFQIESIAERAGVHKTTIYRRWPTRGSLLAAALAATPFRPDGPALPDTGKVADDLRALADSFEAALRSPRTRRIIRELGAAASDPDVATANAAFYAARFEITSSIIRRGIDRGELRSTTDAELIATMFMGAIRFNVIDRGQLPSREWFHGLVAAIVHAAG